MAITIEQVESRLKEIQNEVAKENQTINNLSTEFQQLLGYKQALIDNSTVAEENSSDKTLLTE